MAGSARIPNRRRAARKPRDAYHHGDLRRALVDAALALVTERGPVDWTLREVARRVGVTHNAPYRHFASREALLAAVAEEGFRAITRILEEADARAPRDAESRFRRSLQTYVRFAVENPAVLRLLFSHELADRSAYPSLREAATASYVHLRRLIERCQEAGAVRAGDPDTLALVAWSAAHGFSTLLLEGQVPAASDPAKRETLADQLFAALLQGIGAGRGADRLPPGPRAGTSGSTTRARRQLETTRSPRMK